MGLKVIEICIYRVSVRKVVGDMKVAGMFGFKTKRPEADRRSRSVIIRRPIAYKLTVASVLMIVLTLLAGGVSLWQVLAIGQTIGDARAKELQRARSLESLAAGHRLVASLDHMLVTQDQALMSTDVPVSLGTLMFYIETLHEAGGEPNTLPLLEEMYVTYTELRQGVSEVDLLARQELWAEVDVALEQEIRPVNKRMNLLVRRLVRQADRDVEAVGLRVQMAIWQATLLLAILTALTTVIALGWRQVVFRGLGQSITELRQGVARISGGDLAYKLDVRTGDEIEELGDEFNKMAGELADVINSLEQRVIDRTHGLQAAADVSRATTALLDPEELQNRVVNLVRQRFNLYYVGLFLVDENRRFAVLRAGTGEAGQEMLAQGHRLEVGGESMVGQCVARAEACIALDVGVEAGRFDNPLLPETRSEMALPLRSRGRVVGVMTAQSVEESAFDEADIAVMQTMADQVAVALDNALLFAKTQTALEEMAVAQRRYLGQAWVEYAQIAEKTDYETVYPGVAPLGDAVLPEIRRMVEQQGVTMLAGTEASLRGEPGETGYSALVAPIALRGEIIGALGIHADDARQWSADDVALIEAIAERMAMAADNLRLLDATQRRAVREQLTGEITARMRETLDIETVLDTAVIEIGERLGLAALDVRIGTETELIDRDRASREDDKER